jgi:hypothetical protein
MKVIFLYGLPATGKLTIAERVTARTGYKLFHNHMVVDMLLNIFDFGAKPFVEMREELWLSIVEQCTRTEAGLVFTFTPEHTVRPTFVPELQRIVAAASAAIHFVELTCTPGVLSGRIGAASRHRYKKLTSPRIFNDLYSIGAFTTANIPTPELTLDTSLLTATESADRIIQALQLPERLSTSPKTP